MKLKLWIVLAALAAVLTIAVPARALVPPHFVVPKPDLVVSAVTSSSVTITNRGKVKVGRFSVLVSSGVGCNGLRGVLSGTYTIPPLAKFVSELAPGASVTVSFLTSVTTRTVVADAWSEVKEASEANNRAQLPGTRVCPA